MRKPGGDRGQAGDTSRFAALVEPHYDALYRAAWYWTRSVEDAEDLVQEVCVRAYPRMAELERLDRPRSWLLQVMYRLFVDLTRRHERRYVDPLSDATLESLSDTAPGPEQDAERTELSLRIEQAWRRLDREKRALLVLHDVEGYTLSELTELTGLKEGTLKSRLHRCRVVLGRLLAEDTLVETAAKTGGGKP